MKLRLYTNNGAEYNEGTQSGQNFVFYSSYSGDPLSTSGVTLQAGQSIAIYTTIPTFYFGYGVIEWSSEGNKQVSLVANGVLNYANGNHFNCKRMQAYKGASGALFC